MDEAVLGHLVLEQPQDQVGGRDRRLHSEEIEVLAVARVVDAGDDPVDRVLLARHLADQHVVLVVAGDRDHHVGTLDSGSLEHPQLGGVAVDDVVLELLLDRQVAASVRLDHRHLMVLFEKLAGQVPTDLPRSDDDDVHALSVSYAASAGPFAEAPARPVLSRTAPSSMSIATLVGQIVFSPCSLYHSARSGSRMRAMTVGTL